MFADVSSTHKSIGGVRESYKSIRSENTYQKEKKKKVKDESYKQHRKHRSPEVKFRRNEKNYWPHKSHYFFFTVMIGNGPDFLPYMICFAFEMSGGLFLIIYLVSAFVLAMPMIYMEGFLGRYSMFSNGQMYRMAPIFFGFGVMVLIMNLLYIPVNMVNVSHFFINFLKLMIEPELFQKCPVGAGNCSCFDGRTVMNRSASVLCEHGDYNCTMNKRLKFVTEYIYWETFKAEDQANYPIWQLIISLVVTWACIGIFLILGLRVIGAMLKFMTIVSWALFFVIYLMALTVKGSDVGLSLMVEINVEKINFYKIIVVAFYTVGKLGILVPTGYMTSSAYAKFPKRLGTGGESLLLVTSNVVVSLFFMSGMYAVAGALANEYQFKISEIMSPLIGLYLSMILQFTTHMDAPNSFILSYLFIFWCVQIIRTSINIHLVVLNLYDYLPQLSYFPNYVVMSCVGVCGATSIIACLHYFVPVTEILAVNYIILCINAHVLIESFCVFCCYGVNRLCDDIHFLTGRRPMRFWFLLWYAIPYISLASFITVALQIDELRHMESLLLHRFLKMKHVYAGSSLLFVTLLVTFSGSFLFAILSLRSSNANLLKPQFYWGPPKRDTRISRKAFAPRTSIRSQPPRKSKQRFRERSIKQMHEKDYAEKVKRGRIFVDVSLFRNVHLGKGKPIPETESPSQAEIVS